MKFFHCFGAGVVFCFNLHSLTFLTYTISYDFEIFKEISHNLELLSFQKKCVL